MILHVIYNNITLQYTLLQHFEVGLKNSAAPRFSTHFSVFEYPDETLFLVFEYYLTSSKRDGICFV